MKKIGILTMHKVLNYGSALQAFALLHTLNKLQTDSVLIDYKFPNSIKRSVSTTIRRFFVNLLSGFIFTRKKKRFQRFYQTYFKCTSQVYKTPEDLKKGKFDFDIYMTGSDQVWNPLHVKDDTSFLLPFVDKKATKLAYAASFATTEIPSHLKEKYSELLSEYKAISVREKSGITLAESLTGKKAELVCDPTLLLTKEEWSELAVQVPQRIKEPYILAYILTYAYNPYPEIDNIINEIQNKLNLKLVILDGSAKDLKRKNCTVIKDAGPLEFLSLVKNASFIITTSFHGTAFALNFEKSFYSVVKSFDSSDSRMLNLLEYVDAKDRAIGYNKEISNFQPIINYSHIAPKIRDYRNKSKDFLVKNL